MSKIAAQSALDEMKVGAFKRTASAFRNFVRKGSEEFPPAKGRYHLYASYACPWAARCLTVRSLLGLEAVVSVSIVHPTWQRTRQDEEHCGWVFHDESKGPLKNTLGHGSIPSDDSTVDHVHGKSTIREIYEASNDTLGKYSVPVLFDTEKNVIVNNESSEIIEMFAKEFDEFSDASAAYKDMDLYPAGKDELVKEIDDRIYNNFNNGVYRAGFAQSQEAYLDGHKAVFDTLEWLEAKLDKSRFLLGDTMSMSDIRLYVTLVRFDPVYVVYFKTSLKMIREYPNVYGYLRDLYQVPLIRKNTNLDHIQRHYFTSHPTLNHYAIIPPCGTSLETAHDRATRAYEA
eukprot:TRINITY_DN4654_c1_g1_i1.p1 TRINITY_DN4654_c1_g1~~TRINITY_DN4654_c1_g1_i1.p1  ORF type:complete len:362 (+),score=80.46 TRINITY_DN4654_c1_g1_i1:56-1087(+)